MLYLSFGNDTMETVCLASFMPQLAARRNEKDEGDHGGDCGPCNSNEGEFMARLSRKEEVDADEAKCGAINEWYG